MPPFLIWSHSLGPRSACDILIAPSGHILLAGFAYTRVLPESIGVGVIVPRLCDASVHVSYFTS